jgi:parvulin-like peptidyl-prolyl isomerase
MKYTRNILAVVGATLIAQAATAATASDAGPVLPEPPAIYARIGDKILTTLEVEREGRKRMAPVLKRAEIIKKAGRWTEADDAEIARLRQRFGVEALLDMRRQALMEDLTESSGMRADEFMIELQITSAAKRLGGLDKLVESEGRNLSEIRRELRLRDITRKFYRSFVPQGAPPGPSEIRAYYYENQDQLKEPDSVRVSIIQIAFGDDKEAAFDKVDSLRRELQFAPERFAARAREFSVHKESAERGGVYTFRRGRDELEEIPVDVLPQAWIQAIATLLPGRVSGTIETAEGFVLLKLDDYRKGKDVSFSEVADKISILLRRMEEQRIVADWTDYYIGQTYEVGATAKSED